MKWRRPDLYRGSPAEWRVGGIEVLPIAGAGCALVGAFAVFLVLHFHVNLGIKYFHAAEIARSPCSRSGLSGGTLPARRAPRRGWISGANYRAIPPE